MDNSIALLIEKAKKYGLKESEALVFITLLLEDDAMTQQQLKEKTSLSIGAISEALRSLMLKGLIKVKKNGKTNSYEAIDSFADIFAKLIEHIIAEDVIVSLSLLSKHKSKKITNMIREFESLMKKKQLIRRVVKSDANTFKCMENCIKRCKA